MVLLEFLLLTFNPDQQTDPAAPPEAFADVIAKFKTVPGIASLYLGQLMEKPEQWQYVVRWESAADADAFTRSPLLAELQSALGALLGGAPIMNPPAEYTHSVDAALDAPCTEVCTCWGAEEDFHDKNMNAFADPVGAAGLAGFRGMARATFVQPEQPGSPLVPGRASRIILGWDSKEAHVQHKGVDSVIDKYVHLLAERRKEIELYHVALKKL